MKRRPKSCNLRAFQCGSTDGCAASTVQYRARSGGGAHWGCSRLLPVRRLLLRCWLAAFCGCCLRENFAQHFHSGLGLRLRSAGWSFGSARPGLLFQKTHTIICAPGAPAVWSASTLFPPARSSMPLKICRCSPGQPGPWPRGPGIAGRGCAAHIALPLSVILPLLALIGLQTAQTNRLFLLLLPALSILAAFGLPTLK